MNTKSKTLFLQQYFLPHSAQVSLNPTIFPDLSKQLWHLPLYFEILCLFVTWSVECLLRTGAMPHSRLHAPCWDGADQQLLDWIQLEKERDRQKSPASVYLAIVYPVRGMAHRETPVQCAATWMDPEIIILSQVSQTEKHHVIVTYL